MIRFLAALSLALALAACGEKVDRPTGDDRRSAEGEVLGGTIGDAMLPLDTVKSQSPPLRESPSPGATAEPATDEGDSADEPPAEPSPEPSPDDGA